MNRTRQLGFLLAAIAVVLGASTSFMLVHASAVHSHTKAPAHSHSQALISQVRRDMSRVRNEMRQNQPDHALPVLFPFPPNCTFQQLTLPLMAPAGAATAVLAHVPSDLSQTAGVEYTPCSKPILRREPTTHIGPDDISFHIVSVTRYAGAAGTVYITLDTPSPGAVSRGLYLGTPSGVLSDGARLYAMNTSGPPGLPTTFVQWMRGGMIVTVSSAELPTSRLVTIAGSVDVR